MSVTNARTSLGTMAKRGTDLEPDEAERVRVAVKKLCDMSPGGQSELARAIGVKPSAINQIASGRNSPSLATAKRIAEYLGVAWPDLLMGDVEGRYTARQKARRAAQSVGFSREALDFVDSIAANMPSDLTVRQWFGLYEEEDRRRELGLPPLLGTAALPTHEEEPPPVAEVKARQRARKRSS